MSYELEHIDLDSITMPGLDAMAELAQRIYGAAQDLEYARDHYEMAADEADSEIRTDERDSARGEAMEALVELLDAARELDTRSARYAA